MIYFAVVHPFGVVLGENLEQIMRVSYRYYSDRMLLLSDKETYDPEKDSLDISTTTSNLAF